MSTFLISSLLLVFCIALRYVFSLLKSRSFGSSERKKKQSICKCEFDRIAVSQMQIQIRKHKKSMWMILNAFECAVFCIEVQFRLEIPEIIRINVDIAAVFFFFDLFLCVRWMRHISMRCAAVTSKCIFKKKIKVRWIRIHDNDKKRERLVVFFSCFSSPRYTVGWCPIHFPRSKQFHWNWFIHVG